MARHAKKFIVGKLLNFEMIDINVVKLGEKIQVTAHELKDQGMGMSETFLVHLIIEKLPLKKIDKNPYEVWKCRTSSYKNEYESVGLPSKSSNIPYIIQIFIKQMLEKDIFKW